MKKLVKENLNEDFDDFKMHNNLWAVDIPEKGKTPEFMAAAIKKLAELVFEQGEKIKALEGKIKTLSSSPETKKPETYSKAYSSSSRWWEDK